MENQESKKDPESQVTSETDDAKKEIDLKKKELKTTSENEVAAETEGNSRSPGKDRGL
jgi:hypothetical protein